jgi:hypothetical protein
MNISMKRFAQLAVASLAIFSLSGCVTPAGQGGGIRMGTPKVAGNVGYLYTHLPSTFASLWASPTTSDPTLSGRLAQAISAVSLGERSAQVLSSDGTTYEIATYDNAELRAPAGCRRGELLIKISEPKGFTLSGVDKSMISPLIRVVDLAFCKTLDKNVPYLWGKSEDPTGGAIVPELLPIMSYDQVPSMLFGHVGQYIFLDSQNIPIDTLVDTSVDFGQFSKNIAAVMRVPHNKNFEKKLTEAFHNSIRGFGGSTYDPNPASSIVIRSAAYSSSMPCADLALDIYVTKGMQPITVVGLRGCIISGPNSQIQVKRVRVLGVDGFAADFASLIPPKGSSTKP